MKQHTDIQELLDRYWEGETSLEEERRLREFFAAESIPEQFRQEAAFFRALRAEMSVELPVKAPVQLPRRGVQRYWRLAAASVAFLLMAGAGWWWLARTGPSGVPPVPAIAEHPAPPKPPAIPRVADEQTQQAPAQVQKPRGNKPRKHRPQPLWQTPPPAIEAETEQAVAEIKAALELISAKLNKGKKELGRGLNEVETLDKIIKKKSDG